MTAHQVLLQNRETRRKEARELLTIIQGLSSAVPEMIDALEEHHSDLQTAEDAFRRGMLEAADLIEGYFLAGKARSYTTDERALRQLLVEAIKEQAESEQ